MRAFPIMAETGYPFCYDATHSIQMPTSMGNISGGQREYIPYLTRAAAATGIDAMFIEVHDDPKNAFLCNPAFRRFAPRSVPRPLLSIFLATFHQSAAARAPISLAVSLSVPETH